MAKRRINPNTADLQSLEGLPGIGKTLAVNIVAARPYIELDDLESVKGLGKSRLARIKPYLSFEASGKTSSAANGSADEAGSEKSRVRRKAATTDGKQGPSQKMGETGVESETQPASNTEAIPVVQTFSRTATIWIVLAMGMASILFSVVSAFTTYYVVNGSLDFRRAQTIETIDGLITNVNQDLAVLSSNVEQMDDRLNTLGGLDGRMDAVEGEVQGLGTDIGTALETVGAMQENIDQLSDETAALTEDVGRFEQFVDGLRGLLSELFE